MVNYRKLFNTLSVFSDTSGEEEDYLSDYKDFNSRTSSTSDNETIPQSTSGGCQLECQGTETKQSHKALTTHLLWYALFTLPAYKKHKT